MNGEKEACCEPKQWKNWHGNGGGEIVYCLGLIGAAIYFIGQATTFWVGVLGFLKALVWPAFIVNQLLHSLLG